MDLAPVPQDDCPQALTGRGDETDKIVGLEIGADDDMRKPLNPRELIGRIRAVLHRYGKGGVAPRQTPRDNAPVALGSLRVNRDSKILSD